MPKRRTSSLQRREALQGYLFAAPFLIGFTVFVAFPMLYSIWLMFQKWDLLSPPAFVGLKNIQRAFTDELAL
jgi:ABC-type sugar transport system permease subunit